MGTLKKNKIRFERAEDISALSFFMNQHKRILHAKELNAKELNASIYRVLDIHLAVSKAPSFWL